MGLPLGSIGRGCLCSYFADQMGRVPLENLYVTEMREGKLVGQGKVLLPMLVSTTSV
jgi:hypothetical protein